MKYLFVVIIFAFAVQLQTEQWFQKNNPHFINQPKFKQLITDENTRKNGITFVKFFTPWCRYCRFIKDIIDKLKNQDWNILFYDMNCADQSNMNFCSRVGATSFPHINIYQNGEYREAIIGYYPEHVVRQIFTKYNKTSIQIPKRQNNLKQNQVEHKIQVKTNDDGVNYVQPQIVQISIKQKHQNKIQKNKVQEYKPQSKVNKLQQTQGSQVKVRPGETYIKDSVLAQTRQQNQNVVVTDNNVVQTQKQKLILQNINQKSQRQTSDLSKKSQIQIHENLASYINYLIYGVCIIGGLYYFSHIMKNPLDSTIEQHESEPLVKNKANSVSFQESELVEQRQFVHNQTHKQKKANHQQYNVQLQDEDL